MLVSHFEQRLREKSAREERKIPLRTIVAETGIPLATIHGWKKGELTVLHVRILGTLCDYFRCSICDLLEWRHESTVPGEQP